MKNAVKLILLSISALAATMLSADDETRYRSKSFSGKSLENKSFTAKAYRTDKVQKEKQYRESSKKTGGFWSIFGKGRKKEYNPLPEQKNAENKNYQRDERISLKVEQSDDKALTDAKRLSKSKEVKNKDYKPSDVKRGHDPLLAPRQGIKAPVSGNGK